MDVYLKFVGGGFIHGVPMRDLTEAEARRYGVKRLIDSGLYAQARASKPKPSYDKSMRGPSEDKAAGEGE